MRTNILFVLKGGTPSLPEYVIYKQFIDNQSRLHTDFIAECRNKDIAQQVVDALNNECGSKDASIDEGPYELDLYTATKQRQTLQARMTQLESTIDRILHNFDTGLPGYRDDYASGQAIDELRQVRKAK